MGEREGIEDSVVRAIDRERAMGAPERIKNVVAYTLEHFDQQTKRNSYYSLKGQRVAGFNSIFAVSSIPMAMKYYQEFRRQLTEAGRDLTIATIFSFAPNEEILRTACRKRLRDGRAGQALSGLLGQRHSGL